MAVSQAVLGMNARNFLYIRKYNRRRAKLVADDKLLTKRMLINNSIPTPALITVFRTRDKIRSCDWTSLPSDGFVIKPARGYGGGGIIAMKNWNGTSGYTTSDTYMTKKELETHLLDILDGAFSLQHLPDYAIVEELVNAHPFFRKLSALGMPDIRVVVLNSIPVMSMIRLPTVESRGMANLMQGALAIGVDLRTGITTYGYKKHGKAPFYIPGTKTKRRGIKVPLWDTILLLAAKAQNASKLGYCGVDIVLDAERGPLVLEINTRPGLSIQNANNASLRERLERVENIQHVTPKRGIEVAKSLFGSAFSEKVKDKPITVGVIEQVVLEGEKLIKAVEAKIDTGAFRTSIDKELVCQLGFPQAEETIWVRSASGEQKRPAVKLIYHLKGKKIVSIASTTNRDRMQYPIIIGRNDLKGFVVDPTANTPIEGKYTKERNKQLKAK